VFGRAIARSIGRLAQLTRAARCRKNGSRVKEPRIRHGKSSDLLPVFFYTLAKTNAGPAAVLVDELNAGVL
jgi:hypothetical protein